MSHQRLWKRSRVHQFVYLQKGNPFSVLCITMDAGGVASAQERIRTGQREQSSICKDLISIGKDLISICKDIISRDTPPPKKKTTKF